MEKVYSIISGKGGTGKTTSAINLAAALISIKQSTIVVDANLSTPNIGIHLGAPIVPVTLNHVLNDEAEIADAIYEHSSGLKIIPSSLSIEELKKIKYDKLAGVVKQLKRFSNNIILDSAAGLGKETVSSINSADEIILVTQAEMPAVTDALKAVKLAEQLKKNTKGFIITRYKAKTAEMPVENITDMLEIPLLGVVPEDKNIQKSLILRNPIVISYPHSKASKAYQEIVRKLLGIEEKPGFFSRVFKS